MTTFNEGNTVICISNEDNAETLTKGKEYTVEEIVCNKNMNGIIINTDKGEMGLFSASRFKLKK